MRLTLHGHWRETWATISLLCYWTLGLYLLFHDLLPWAGTFLGWEPWLVGLDN